MNGRWITVFAWAMAIAFGVGIADADAQFNMAREYEADDGATHFPPADSPAQFPLEDIASQAVILTEAQQRRITAQMTRAIKNEVDVRQTETFWGKKQLHDRNQRSLQRAKMKSPKDVAATSEDMLARRAIADMQQIRGGEISASAGVVRGVVAKSDARRGSWPSFFRDPRLAADRKEIESLLPASGTAAAAASVQVRQAVDRTGLRLTEMLCRGEIEVEEYLMATDFLSGLCSSVPGR
jgi:hypothetical protein